MAPSTAPPGIPEFVDRLCATPPPPPAAGEFVSSFAHALCVFEHLEQHPPCSLEGARGALVDPREASSRGGGGDASRLELLASDRATIAFQTESMTCAVHEHVLADDEFALVPVVGGGYWLVPVRTGWCAGQQLPSPSRRVDDADLARARVLLSNSIELGRCWRSPCIGEDDDASDAIGWGPTGGSSLVRKRGRRRSSWSEADRLAFAHAQAVRVSCSAPLTIAHPELPRSLDAHKTTATASDALAAATYYALFDDDYDETEGASRRLRI